MMSLVELFNGVLEVGLGVLERRLVGETIEHLSALF